MSLFRSLALGTVLALALTSQAEARRGIGGGTAEILDFVAQTQIPVNGGADKMMALCHLIKKYHVVYLPVWYQSEGYVLSDNACAGESYFSITAEQLAAARKDGLIAADIPEVAKLTSQEEMTPWLWGALVAFGVLMFIRQMIRTVARRREIGGASDAVIRLVDAMCHAAKADGRIDAREIAAIQMIALRLTGTEYPEANIRRMIDLSKARLTPAQFAAFGKGLGVAQKELVMQAVLMVLGADGEIAKKEQGFINGLANGLKITQPQFQRILVEARGAMA